MVNNQCDQLKENLRPVDLLSDSEKLCILASGIFFITALVMGIAKWRGMANSKSGAAPYYVNIAHRASLMYSFAALLLGKFSTVAELDDDITFYAVSGPLLYFGFAIGTYIIHSILGDTKNQIKDPKLGRFDLPAFLTPLFMITLVIAEIGGFLVLFYGFVKAAYL